MSVDWQAVRAEFPALSNWTFLNSATFGQLPRRAVEAMQTHLAHRDELACADFLDWYTDADRLRRGLARLIHAAPDDIAFIPNASTGLAIVMGGIDWRPGDRILTLADEFPNYLYLAAPADRHRVEFAVAPWERFYDSVDDRTRLVAISEVNYSSGFRPPLEEMSCFLRERGVLLFVDGTQSVGALHHDVRRTQPDMLAVHGYKWMLAPTGVGFMYVRPELRERLPSILVGWRSHKTWREVDHLHHGKPEFVAAAERYEGGSLPFPLLYAMEQSVDLMLEIGAGAIERRVLDLADRTRSLLRRLGATAPDGTSQIVAGQFPGRDVSALARELKARRVLVAARKGYLRVSPHLYNNEEDLARLEEELSRLL